MYYVLCLNEFLMLLCLYENTCQCHDFANIKIKTNAVINKASVQVHS